jgi:hypothetical protein
MLRRIDSFDTANPERLAEQLARLENNIVAALAVTSDRLKFSDWQSSGRPMGSYGVITRVDTSVAAIAATLPSVSSDTAALLVGFLRRGASNVTVEPVEATALIDGAASVTLAANGLYLYTHDGEQWSRL